MRIIYSHLDPETQLQQKLIANFLKNEGFEIKKIEYNFVSKDRILNLNKKYLKHNTETDIITFDYSKSKKIQAEMHLCFSVIERNAKENMQSLSVGSVDVTAEAGTIIL